MKRKLILTALVVMAATLSSCSVEKMKMTEKQPKSYTVKKLTSEMPIDGNWDKPQWQNTEPLELTLYMGDKPEHFPVVKAKMAYDDDNVYVIFKVDDNYIKATTTENQGPVCRDSCVEFFFTPNSDTSTGYMNMETNCCGKILFYYQKERGVGAVKVADSDLEKIEIAHSLPYESITEEIKSPKTWTLEYRIPIEVIKTYTTVEKPESGVLWKANFYKCGDKTSKPHWLTWSFVDKPKPDFHVPNCFGTLKFE
ncbi:MAG: carbohydrate-binding family 9-like protein [Sedimentisphaeraceae bacterium JB056]